MKSFRILGFCNRIRDELHRKKEKIIQNALVYAGDPSEYVRIFLEFCRMCHSFHVTGFSYVGKPVEYRYNLKNLNNEASKHIKVFKLCKECI